MSRPAARRVAAPAKLNLGLRVVGRRADGYHEIESLFVPLDLGDTLEVALDPSGAGAVTLALDPPVPGLPAGADNLAARAARAFLEAAGLRCDVALRLRKRIPVGAGLGGGSSDAGAVLRALADAFPAALPRPRLAELALALGADVPFFLDPRPARVSGIGERIEPLGRLPAFSVLLATPGPPLSTAEVYRAYDGAGPALTPGAPGRTMPALSALRAGGGPIRIEALTQTLLEALLANDLEPAALQLRPSIGRVRAQVLAAGARAVGMSGSGPTVFGIFDDADAAGRARASRRWEPPVRVGVASVAAVS